MAAYGKAGAGGRAMVRWAAMLAVLAWSSASPAAPDPAEPPKTPPHAQPAEPLASDAMRSDAALWDVCFVDPQRGWAVGDRGTIWHTDDGGRQWALQPSGVACRLESVWFINAEVGWAAGWTAHPYLHTGAGVLLSTQDGGKHWTHNPKLLLPALKRVRMLDARHGWVAGCASAVYPSGVLVTDSGGLGWNPVPGPKTPGWLAADAPGPQRIVLAGRGAALGTVRQGNLRMESPLDVGLREPRRLKWAAPNGAWLVGQGGLVLRSDDGGLTWRSPPGDMPDLAPWCFDFAALEVRGPSCWIAGTPGSRVFFSADAGRSWAAFPTGQTLPLSALWFCDDQNGWAVGQLGTILATGDGGRSWRRQRSGGTRVAILGLFGDAENLPLEPFARLAANEGYLAAVELLARRDLENPPRDEIPLADRAHEALVRLGAAGATTAWQFPLRPRGLEGDDSQVVGAWDRLHEGHGLDALEAHLARRLRTWRPDVILTPDSAQAAGPPGHLVNQAVLRAVAMAADPAAHPELFEQLALEPWQVQRVYGALAPGLPGDAGVNASQWADRLGRSLGDLAFPARGLLEDRYRPGPDAIAFQRMFDHAPQGAGRGDFFGGIALAPRSGARRPPGDPVSETADPIQHIARRRRIMQAIVDRQGRDPRGPAALLAQVDDLTRGLDPASAAEILFQLAQACRRSGNRALAAEAFELVASRHKDHPLARPSLAWLVQYYASSEVAWWVESSQRGAMRQASTLPAGALPEGNRLERSAALGEKLPQVLPDLAAQPAVGFALASAQRQRGQARQAERFYAAQGLGTARDAWWACARAEQWLAEPKGPAPKPVLRCATVRERPRLDGRLDDDAWKGAASAELHHPRDDAALGPATVRLACDGQFLYLAIRARQAPGGKYDPTPGPRPRDADLSARDRVELLIDLDRDYATYYRLVVDSRGWTAEDCWGDPAWNPTWYVAAGSEEGHWTVEAAIPLDQLTSKPPVGGAAWAIGLQRTAPGAGFQSWSTPAAPEVIPEGFGYLVFE